LEATENLEKQTSTNKLERTARPNALKKIIFWTVLCLGNYRGLKWNFMILDVF
jgi:hypothetical protein